MQDIFKYTDYRKFLYDFLQEQKELNDTYTYKFFSEKCGFKTPSHVTMILKGEANLSVTYAKKIAVFLKLGQKATNYFLLLLQFNNAKSHKAKTELFQELALFKKSVIHKISEENFAFYDKWYHAALRVLCEFYPCGENYDEISKLLIPHVSAPQVKKSLQLLGQLGILEKNSDGFWKPTQNIITSGWDLKNIAVTNYVISSIKIAFDILEIVPSELRNISTLTIGISPQGYIEIVNAIRKFREEVLLIAAKEKAEAVYQLSMQLLPLTKPDRTRSDEKE